MRSQNQGNTPDFLQANIIEKYPTKTTCLKTAGDMTLEYRDNVDFRKSINGLSAIVEAEMDIFVMSGALFLFCNKARDKIKVLYWDKTEVVLW